MDPDKRHVDSKPGLPLWTRTWQVRMLALAAIAILLIWTGVSLVAYLTDRERVTDSQPQR